jgi:hypothetical protein
MFESEQMNIHYKVQRVSNYNHQLQLHIGIVEIYK